MTLKKISLICSLSVLLAACGGSDKDDTPATNSAPTATNVSFTGALTQGQTLTGSYEYKDADNDAEGTTTFQWLRDGAEITGATQKEYVVTADDLGKKITFTVTPVASTGETEGTETKSSDSTIPATNTAPTATSVSITGSAFVGETLEGKYVYNDAEGDKEKDTTLQWLRNDVDIPNATSSTYKVTDADIGADIKFAVTPSASSGAETGTQATSESVTGKASAISVKCNATTEANFTDTFINNGSGGVADRAWSKTDFNNPTLEITIDDIIAEFNAGRAGDPTVKEKLKMPSKDVWDAYTPSQKILYLVNSERCARGIMPFEGIDPRMTETAETWAKFLADNNRFDHGDNDSAANWYTARITASGVNTDPNSAEQNADFLAQGENLAFLTETFPGTQPVIAEPEAQAVYNWMYYDKDATTPKDANGDPTGPATFGHRTFITIKDLKDNYGPNGTEGLFGGAVNIKESPDGSALNTRINIVMHAFDPNTNYAPKTGDTITPAPAYMPPAADADCESGTTLDTTDLTCK